MRSLSLDPPALAKAAEAFVGVPFRLHGRDPATGLDCIGLLDASLKACGAQCRLPNGYVLRTGAWPDLPTIAANLGFWPAQGLMRPGDVCLLRPSSAQLHLAIAGVSQGTLVEAHAGLRRVVISPLQHPHPVTSLWRLAP